MLATAARRKDLFMIGHAARLHLLDNMIWTVVAGVAVIVLIASIAGGFHIVLSSYAAPAGIGLLLIGVARYYRAYRVDLKLASSLESTAQVLVFAAVAAPLSYIAASSPMPLQDATFDAMDRALGFNWNELLAFMYRSPEVFELMRVTYLSLTVQMTAVVLLLGFTGRLPWLRVYMLAFIFAALLTIAVSALLPAEGAWLHYGLKANPAAMPVSHTSWPVFLGLRDGSFRLVMASGSEGIITFPSLHAALAVILIAAFWPVPIARWVSAVVNALMLAATPIDGSHYFVDVLAGIAIAVLCLVVAHKLVGRVSLIPATTMPLELAPAQ
jgi:membrane-associated phospholipid phosphatase